MTASIRSSRLLSLLVVSSVAVVGAVAYGSVRFEKVTPSAMRFPVPVTAATAAVKASFSKVIDASSLSDNPCRVARMLRCFSTSLSV